MNINEENLRESLIEILAEEKKQQKSKIPKNVDSSYKVILNLNMKELFLCVLPVILSLGIGLLTLFIIDFLNLYTVIAVLLFNLVLFLTIYGFMTITPVRDRKNIRYIDYMRQNNKFNNRQKIFFYEGRDI